MSCEGKEGCIIIIDFESNAVCQKRIKKTYSSKEKMSQGLSIQQKCLSSMKGTDTLLLASKDSEKIILMSPPRGI